MWIDQVVEVCERSCFEYIITQHHADKMDLSPYNLSDESMYDTIRRSTLFISRFSTGMLESMALGKPVIYHNPHGERMNTFVEPMGAYPITSDADTLEQAIAEIVGKQQDYRQT